MELQAFELVILRRPAVTPEIDDDSAQRIQSEHLAFYAQLRKEGTVVTNGPVLDQPDETWRGLGFYRTGSLEDTRTLAEQDPAVVAGVLEVEVMTWWCRPGTMVLPGAPFSFDPT
jgi:uncharacterized protein YciI